MRRRKRDRRIIHRNGELTGRAWGSMAEVHNSDTSPRLHSERQMRRVAVAWEAGCARVCVEVRRAERVVVCATLLLNFGGAMG